MRVEKNDVYIRKRTLNSIDINITSAHAQRRRIGNGSSSDSVPAAHIVIYVHEIAFFVFFSCISFIYLSLAKMPSILLSIFGGIKLYKIFRITLSNC